MDASTQSYNCRGTLSKKLAPFLKTSELADIQIKVGQKIFAAHRVVLASWSEELARMMSTSSGNILELTSEATDKEIEVFEIVLQFLYSGEMTFSADSVKMVMSLAKRLGLQKLGEMAQEWIGDMINQGSMISAITWLRDAEEYGYVSLRNDCIRTLSMYFQYIPKASWLGLSLEEVCSLLDCPFLVADNELEVIARVDDWLKAKGSADDNRDTYLQIAAKIRLAFLEISELLDLQESSPIVKFASQHLPSVLSESFKYRALSAEIDAVANPDDSKRRRLQKSYATLLKFNHSPRLYLDFLPPGKVSDSHHSGRRGRVHTDTHNRYFKEISIDSYKSDMDCLMREDTGVWSFKSSRCYFQFAIKLDATTIGEAEAWSVKYEITVGESLRSDAAYQIVLVTSPQDKDEDFFLPENPIVMIKEGAFIKRSSGDRQSVTFTVVTPPIFAGRKPKRVEVAAIAYVKKLSLETDIGELD